MDNDNIIQLITKLDGSKTADDLKKIEQVEGRMPTFVIKVNNVKYLHFSYMRFIENQIKEAFDFSMVPILVYYKDIASKERK